MKSIIVRAPNLCLYCKGRLWCGEPKCPILEQIKISKGSKIKKELSGPGVGIFVSWYNYPNIAMGPMIAEEEIKEIANSPNKWFGVNYDRIISIRGSIIRGVRKKGKFYEKVKEIGMAEKPVEIEINFEKIRKSKLSFSSVLEPMGPSGIYKNLEILENPKIPKKISELEEEKIKVREVLPEIVGRYNIYYLQQLLSAGVLGEKKRIVPTRWSITATDKIIADYYIQKIKNFAMLNNFLLLESHYLHNHFYVILLPGKWEFEQFEAWAPRTVWNFSGNNLEITEEYEGYKGRKDYAKKQGGGYYAARLGSAEGMYKMRRQAKVVVIREIDEGYQVPVGVWEVRENVRNAFRQKYKKFDQLTKLLNYLKNKMKNKMEGYLAQTKILLQKRISEF